MKVNNEYIVKTKTKTVNRIWEAEVEDKEEGGGEVTRNLLQSVKMYNFKSNSSSVHNFKCIPIKAWNNVLAWTFLI